MLDGRVRDLDDVGTFVMGRLYTSGFTDAALVAAGTRRLEASATDAASIVAALRALDAEADARLPVAPLRTASRRLGRQLTRLAGRCWSDVRIDAIHHVHPDGGHQAVVLAAVASTCGITPRQAAALSLHHLVTTPIQAAVKLAGLDPFGAAALTVSFGDHIEVLADRAAALVDVPLADLPCASGPLVDIAAVLHDIRPDRLFAT